MAKRANQSFVIAVDKHGKRIYQKDQIVPSDVAKRVPGLVYDDTDQPPAVEPFFRGPAKAGDASKKARGRKATEDASDDAPQS